MNKNSFMNAFQKLVAHKAVEIIMALLLLVAMFFVSRQGAIMVGNMNAESNLSANRQFTVVIDAGHGGIDGGKVGVGGVLEKDINLKITRKLRSFLTAAGINVVLTRDSEFGLYDEGDSNKKVADMKKRLAIMEEADADVVVSIHQNSYTDDEVHGAEVYYYTQSEKGSELAKLLQEEMRNIDPTNKRQIKANNSYYLLKKAPMPIVIVECGYLSNPDEAQKLNSNLYQYEVAWALHKGILKYLGLQS